MRKLYSLTLPPDTARMSLYIKGLSSDFTLHGLSKNQKLDFTTYFNSFCVKKWRKYTTISAVRLSLELRGRFRIAYIGVDEAGTVSELFSEEIVSSRYEHTFSENELSSIALLGFILTSLEESGAILDGAWCGEFACWREKTIGISICTFKREKYVTRTLKTLEAFIRSSSWLRVLVVDNGNTLPLREDQDIRVIHSRNYGGSGGFTRGMIEYAEEEHSPDYVLLMDDDIILDTTSIERTHSLLCGVKDVYAESFVAGSMLSTEEPTVQFENTAYWDKVTYRSIFQGWNLDDIARLAQNGDLQPQKNQYAGWWYCCIPTDRIGQIGYPLPLFIKNDDMEYSIRNDREILTMNGIGVWHQVFDAKQSPVMSYFANRNSLILQHFAHGCSRMTALVSIILKTGKRVLHCDGRELCVLAKAVNDYADGLSALTTLPADDFMNGVARYLSRSFSLSDLFCLLRGFFRVVLNWKKLDKSYNAFREENMSDSVFWKSYFQR